MLRVQNLIHLKFVIYYIFYLKFPIDTSKQQDYVRAESEGLLLPKDEIVHCSEHVICVGGDIEYFRITDGRGWLLSKRGATEYARENGAPEDLPHSGSCVTLFLLPTYKVVIYNANGKT